VSTAIPAWVIAGPLGCGKTTLIARWLADKPAGENWVVLLNEYSDAGIDALTVAAAARGAYDVRLVPGGCLCCAGEADFRRNLQDLVERVRPHGILVEPSGIGHPGGIVEELLAHEAAGSIRLCGIAALLDPEHIDSDDTNVTAACEIADVLLLSKADLATDAERARFAARAAGLFPAKSWIGELRHGQFPLALRAMRGGDAGAGFDGVADGGGGWPLPARDPASPRGALPVRPPQHVHERALAHVEASAAGQSATADVTLDGGGARREFHHLGRRGARWSYPRAQAFSESRLLSVLSSDPALIDPALRRPERFKAVLRVDEEQWLLLQMAGGRVAMQPTSWRRDNRIELQLPVDSVWDPAAWERLWERCRQR
jgi:G3E family GTPase